MAITSKLTKKQFKAEFAKLMENTSILSNLSDSEIVKRYSEILSFVEPNIPIRLFRFRRCDLDSVISFEQGTIPVCTASKFPDKYDSTGFYDHKTLATKAKNTYNQLMPNLLQLLKKDPSMFPQNPIVSKALELIQTSKTEDEILNEFWKEFEPLLSEWDAHTTGQEQWPRTNKTTKIACFTETVKSKFMWDSYAAGYTGFALEYDFRKWRMLTANNHAVMLLPVIYSSHKMDATEMIDRLSTMNYMENNQVPESVKQLYYSIYPVDRLYFQKIYLYKDKAEYSHEKEWRLIDIGPLNTPGTNEEFYSLPDAHCLKAIYYGPEMETRYKTHLRTTAKQKGIKEYDVVLDSNSRKYDLKIIKL